ncbi:MAG: 50S ribosomal protein L29 [Proteobacteria bacterium]|nr:50S ribosomal protein L29 [Pseudomonadota bacterium]MBU1738288.1 50S ribosomal protein L29 [Pseudomonadota bacterium]
MKTKDLRELSIEDLVIKEKDLAQELFNLKFQHGIRSLENPAKLGVLSKQIARVKTIANEKRREQAAS